MIEVEVRTRRRSKETTNLAEKEKEAAGLAGVENVTTLVPDVNNSYLRQTPILIDSKFACRARARL